MFQKVTDCPNFSMQNRWETFKWCLFQPQHGIKSETIQRQQPITMAVLIVFFVHFHPNFIIFANVWPVIRALRVWLNFFPWPHWFQSVKDLDDTHFSLERKKMILKSFSKSMKFVWLLFIPYTFGFQRLTWGLKSWYFFTLRDIETCNKRS